MWFYQCIVKMLPSHHVKTINVLSIVFYPNTIELRSIMYLIVGNRNCAEVCNAAQFYPFVEILSQNGYNTCHALFLLFMFLS